MDKTGDGLRELIRFLESLEEMERSDRDPEGPSAGETLKEPSFFEDSIFPEDGSDASGLQETLPGSPEITPEVLVKDFFRKKGPAIRDLLPPGSHRFVYIKGYGFVRFH